MAKKDGRKKKDTKSSSSRADTIEAVRSAVERALPEGSRDRGRELVDEVARAVTRVRDSLEQHGVFDELGKLRAEVESLARRVGNLERPGSTARPVKAQSTATKRSSTASKASRTKGSTTKRASTKRASTKRASTKRASTKASSTKRASTKRGSTKASSTKSSSTKRASTSKRARSKPSSS